MKNNEIGTINGTWGPFFCVSFHLIIHSYVDGKGKREGTLGKFLMQDDDGVEFGCPPGKGYNYKMLADMLTNIHNYIGKRATFTYFERTKAGSYRHPLFKTLRNYE